MAKIDLSKTWHQIGAVATAIAGIGVIYGGLVAIGVDLPLTESSPVIQRSVEFDKEHELEIYEIKATAKRDRRRSILSELSQVRLFLMQYEGKVNMTDGDKAHKSAWETQLLALTEEYKSLAPKK